jgi:hypothetical protein
LALVEESLEILSLSILVASIKLLIVNTIDTWCRHILQ